MSNNIRSSVSTVAETHQQKNKSPNITRSDEGVGYSKLWSLLGERKWLEADRQAQKVFYRLAGREKEGYIRDEDIARIPIQDLKKFDWIWRKQTQGRFGISVQQKLFQETGQVKESEFQPWSPFAADLIGYRQGSRWKELDQNHWRRFLSCIGWLSDGHYLTEQERVKKLCTATQLRSLPSGFLPYEIYRNTLDPLASSNPLEFVRIGFIGASAVFTGNASVNTIGRAFFLLNHRDLDPGDDLDDETLAAPEPTEENTQTLRQILDNSVVSGSPGQQTKTIIQIGQRNINIGSGQEVQIDNRTLRDLNEELLGQGVSQESLDQLRQEIAIYLYQTEHINLETASKLAELSPEMFRQLLEQRNISFS